MFSASFQGSSIHFEYVLSAAKPRRSMDGSEKVRGGRGVDHILEMDSRNSSLDNKLLIGMCGKRCRIFQRIHLAEI